MFFLYVFLFSFFLFFFFFNDTATTEIYTLSLHDALPIFPYRYIVTSIRLITSKVMNVKMPRYDTVACRSTKRSEEHTSELQSLAYLVCRLLLEKKKKKKQQRIQKNKDEYLKLKKLINQHE